MESGLRLICQNFIPMGPRFVQSKIRPNPLQFWKKEVKVFMFGTPRDLWGSWARQPLGVLQETIPEMLVQCTLAQGLPEW